MIAERTPPGPAFDDYCKWLTEEGGSVRHRQNRWGGYAVLHSPDGTLCVVIPKTAMNEMLVSELIEYLDTRLGLVSPWRRHPPMPQGDADDDPEA